MSGPRDDGGPVFPVKRDIYDKGSEVTYSVQFTGMSLRDWFAGQALVSVADRQLPPASIAIRAYEIADAMLLYREPAP